MSRRSGNNSKLELRLNLSPPSRRKMESSPTRSASDSPPSSCISSENQEDASLSTPEASSMVVVGCPRCLMYVMLSENDPKCPKCKSSVLLDFHHENFNNSRRS